MKKNCLSSLILLATSLAMVGCSSKSKDTPLLQTEVTIMLDGGLSSKSYDLKFKYDDNYFLKDAKDYDKGLSELSFGTSLVSKTIQTGTEFFKKTEYKDVYVKGYDADSSEDSCAFMIAHKNIKEYDVVSVFFRGFDYKKEWANNLKIGETGNHKGFSTSTSIAYSSLKEYIVTYCQSKTIKLWINGYSRGGALSNVLANEILKNKEISVTEENMFVYTFESPRGLVKENAIEYKNVHNIVNGCDLVTNIAPTEYGLYRCGTDVEIYNENVLNIVRAFDEDLIMPEFITTAYYKNDKQVLNYILSGIVNNPGIADDRSANDREHFSKNYEGGVSYIVGLLFSLKGTTRTKLINSLKGMGSSILTMLGDETGAQLSYFLVPYLKTDSIAYDNATLLANCAVICKAFNSLANPLMNVFMNANADITRILDMHYPEVTYALMLNAHK